ncbi:MAG: Trp family transcriptional regulator [Lentisphaeria bacterium]|nr:Trp family transcriptional regulator [Lentisphaeria bacterium]
MALEPKIAPWVDELADILLRTRNRAELAVVLQGLLTPSELEGIHLRWCLLQCLEAGFTQRDISQRLGISLGKIARGSRLMKYGEDDFCRVVRRVWAEYEQEGKGLTAHSRTRTSARKTEKGGSL